MQPFLFLEGLESGLVAGHTSLQPRQLYKNTYNFKFKFYTNSLFAE